MEPNNVVHLVELMTQSIKENPGENDLKHFASIEQVLLNFPHSVIQSNELLPISRNLGKKIFRCLRDKTIQTSSSHLCDVLSLAAALIEINKFDWCSESPNVTQWNDDLLLLVSSAVVQAQSQYSLESEMNCRMLHSCFMLIEEAIHHLIDCESEPQSETSNSLVCRRLTDLQESLIQYLSEMSSKDLDSLTSESTAILAGSVRLFSAWTAATNWSGVDNIPLLMKLFTTICGMACNKFAVAEKDSIQMDCAGFLMSSLYALSSSNLAVFDCSEVMEQLCSLMQIMWPSVITGHAPWNVTKVSFLSSLLYNILCQCEGDHPNSFVELANHVTLNFPDSKTMISDSELLEISVDLTLICLTTSKHSAHLSLQQIDFINLIYKGDEDIDPSLKIKIQTIFKHAAALELIKT